MPRYAYVNGRYVRHADACVHVEDRGYQFADGVYEVVALRGGRLIDEVPHLDRLARSLKELDIAEPMSGRSLRQVMRELILRNRCANGLLYIQVTRGVAARDHAYPRHPKPSVVMTVRRARKVGDAQRRGVGVITIPDIRWARCDIKSVSLLPNVMGRQQALEAGAYEAWQIDRDGNVTEGTASNAWIVTTDNKIVTRDASQAILNGITRRAILKLAAEKGYTLEERAFDLEEVRGAREAFLTSSSSFVVPVIRLDNHEIGDGSVGDFTSWLQGAYQAYMGAAAWGATDEDVPASDNEN